MHKLFLYSVDNIYIELIKKIILEYSVEDFSYFNPILLSRNINYHYAFLY